MAREADVAYGTRTDATRHARPRGRAARAHAVPRWRGRVGGATQNHAEARVLPRGSVRLASEGPMVIVLGR